MNIKLIILVLFISLTQVLTACTGSITTSTPTPAVQPTPTSDPFESAKVVQAFWKALETGDVDATMAYVGDTIDCRGACYFTGKETFRSYLEGYLKAGYSTKVRDLKTVGSIVINTW